MRWQIKVLAQHALSYAPGASLIARLGRRYVTRTTGLTDEQHRQRLRWGGLAYARALLDSHDGDLSGVTHHDIGAGWQPSVPFLLAGLGVRHQHLTDVEHHLTTPGCTVTANSLAANSQWIAQQLDLPHYEAPRFDPGRTLDQALAQIGISYEVATPALAPGVADGSVDFVSCSGVLPYIPEPNLPAFLRQCHRVVSAHGRLGVYAHLVDDLAATDPRISAFNFLRYDETVWQRWICSDHYSSNRLRLDDYTRLFEQVGFDVVSLDSEPPSDADLDFLGSATLSDRFRGRDPQLLGVRRFVAVLSKKP